MTEELWFRLGKKGPIHCQKWPKYDPELLKEKRIQLIVQINGKVRDRFEVDSDISQEKATELTLKRENVKKWLLGQTIKKVVFVPNKLINIVI
jgi:leucyl-tRNA synthetase